MTRITRRTLGTLLVGSLPVLTRRAALATGPAPERRDLKIGLIGAGQVGGTLAGLWVAAGYHVMLSARSEDEAREAAARLGPSASAGTPAQAAAYGDVVVLAVPFRAIPSLGQQLSGVVKGKILLDPSNFYSFRDGAIAATAAQDGAGPTTSRYFPGARVVRAFNSIDMSVLRSEARRAAPLLAVPVAGDDPAAVSTVADLVRAAGFDPVITGNLASSVLFQPGGPGFEVRANAAELRSTLGIR
ncbi:NADPH-dependent F420 reductase [Acetobacter sp. AN02]|uniref:NADPH-dependent F420 reductase n=1 Tax=Acetobacter sp. AN02 TaxID=2894186 RepID=UPI0024344D23|nr:NADPH-dependent F420 reductase [Acetobacter sp. AN02]MDG6094257.1 NADPH-dependent F420 reductase [Acetobacter sp. AN02]